MEAKAPGEPGVGASLSAQPPGLGTGFGAPMNGGALIVWDYDWSLINTNSDTYVVEQLRPELMERFSASNAGWTEVMDYQMQGLFERGVSKEEVIACVAGVPCFEACREAVRVCSEKAVQIILSDANTVFIEAFLERSGLRPLV